MYMQSKFEDIMCSYSADHAFQTCARVLLEEPDRRTFLKRFRRPNLENVHRQALCKTVNTMARKVIYCPYCSATNGTVKKVGALKIVHDKFRAKKTIDEMEKWKRTFAPAVEAQKELGMYLNKAVHEDLNPLKTFDLFKRISDEVSSMRSEISNDIQFMLRIVNYLVSNLSLVALKNISGSISLFPPSVSAHQSRRMVLQMKMISL